MQALSGSWSLSQSLMAPKGYESLSQDEPANAVHGNGYLSVEDNEFIYDGGEWDDPADTRSGKKTSSSRGSPCSSDDDREGAWGNAAGGYTKKWDYAALDDDDENHFDGSGSAAARSRGSTFSARSDSSGSSTNTSPGAKAAKTFTAAAATAAAAVSSVTNTSGNRGGRGGGGFWGFFGKGRQQETRHEPLRGASA